MTTLMIKDLSLTAELDRKAMAAVHGGRLLGVRPFSFDIRYSDDHSSHDVTSQWLKQEQNVQAAVGNGNSYAFATGGDANAYITLVQDGKNIKR